MRAPANGIVKRIATLTPGAVIEPGGTIMEIVPLDDTLMIEAKISPSDIAFIHVGQEAKVRITAYDFSVYGALRSEEHTSELQSLMRISYAVFCLKKKTQESTSKCDRH